MKQDWSSRNSCNSLKSLLLTVFLTKFISGPSNFQHCYRDNWQEMTYQFCGKAPSSIIRISSVMDIACYSIIFYVVSHLLNLMNSVSDTKRKFLEVKWQTQVEFSNIFTALENGWKYLHHWTLGNYYSEYLKSGEIGPISWEQRPPWAYVTNSRSRRKC
jgi:hypothetical protein